MPYTPPTYPHLPDVIWPAPSSGVPPRPDINEVATSPSDQQAQVAAENAPLRVVYGEDRIGAQVADVLMLGDSLVVVAVWCEGEIDSISDVWMGDEALPDSVVATHYTGTSGQTVNATLVSAYASVGVTYADALPGIAYSVFLVPSGASSGFPAFAAKVRGRKVYDPRTSTTAWSDNPALCLADFLASTVYGWGRTVDYAAGVADAADANDEDVGGGKRRLIGLTLSSVSECRQWVEALRAYAGCYVVAGAHGYRLVPDRPSASVMEFTASNIVAGSMRLKKRGVRDIPTVMDIRYTDTSVVPWAEKSAIVAVPGVAEGAVPRRESQVSLPGIKRYSQAYREAVERLNHLTLEDLEATWETFDEALALEVGDVITVSHPVGLSAKLMRVVAPPVAREPGRWTISAREYDPNAYSESVETEPTYPDTTLPAPSDPPAITDLAAEEEVYQLLNGTWASRLRMTWSAVDFPFVEAYRVEVWAGSELVASESAAAPEYRTAAIEEGVTYTVRVAVVSVVGAVGEWVQADVTAAGKYLLPTWTAGSALTVFEVGGTTYLSWPAAVDLDIWRYDVRYGPVGGGYSAATRIDLVDALRLQTDLIPAGSWTVWVDAVDSVRQYTGAPLSASVTVTSDAGSFLVDSYDSTSPTLTNMAAYTLAPTDTNTYYITDDGAAFEGKFTSGLDTYTSPLASYHSSVTSTWLGESEDFGVSLSGQWTGTASVQAISGAAASSMGFSADLSAWVYQAGLSHKRTARGARMKHEALTTSTMLVTVPTQTIRLSVTAREETKSGTSSASAGVLVELDGTYVAAQSVSVNPEGSTARYGVADRVLVAPVDGLVYQGTVSGTSGQYAYHRIATPARVIQSGDYLEFDVFVERRPAGTSSSLGGVIFQFSDGTYSYDSPTLVDQSSVSLVNGTTTTGEWVARKSSLSSRVGKTLSTFWLYLPASSASGDVKVIWRSIRITDGAGTTRATIWASGEPSASAHHASSGYSSLQCGPANSFLANVFDSAGSRIASAFRAVFKGV